MKRKSVRTLCIMLALFVLVGTFYLKGQAEAAGSIYVNDSQNTLGVDLKSAYVVGGNGEVSVTGGAYAITGNGIVEVGQSGDEPVPAPDGGNVRVKYNTVKIGLYYYYSSSRDTSLTSANLENKIGSGYKFGYYDSARVFRELGSTSQTRITMTPTGSGREVTVTATDTNSVLYVHDGNSTYNLAVRPISNSKAVTWFKGNTYNGDFEYYRYVADKLTVINILPLEDYIKGVVPYEMSASWPLEALKAQALCARSYYAYNVGSYSRYGFDLTGDQYSQAYLGTLRANSNTDAAVDQTSGQYITFNGSIISALYSSSDGGGTENSENVWSAALPYIRGKIDPYEDAVPSTVNGKKSWRYEFTGAQLAAKLGNKIGDVVSVFPEYSPTNNVIKITFYDANGNSTAITKDYCRTTMGVPSIHYTIKPSSTNTGSFVIEGGGYGHNLGMSQFGAYSMAKNYGFNYRQIIGFYYTGVAISQGVI